MIKKQKNKSNKTKIRNSSTKDFSKIKNKRELNVSQENDFQ